VILETACVGMMQTNCYILASKEGSLAVIIDPGAEERKVRKLLEKHRLKPAFIINTHGHYDHIAGDDKFGVPVYIHEDDAQMLKDPGLNLSGIFSLGCSVKSEIRLLEDKQRIKLDDIELEVRHMPGHTPGGIALVLRKPQEGVVFTGDSLFCQGVGRTDLAGGNETALIKAIKDNLFTLPDNTVIYPGHGPVSTIGQEKNNL